MACVFYQIKQETIFIDKKDKKRNNRVGYKKHRQIAKKGKYYHRFTQP